MTAEYPKGAQNPPQEEGMRPDDQPSPRTRVPDNEPDVTNMTTDERMDQDPKRKDVVPPAAPGTPAEDAVREIDDEGEGGR